MATTRVISTLYIHKAHWEERGNKELERKKHRKQDLSGRKSIRPSFPVAGGRAVHHQAAISRPGARRASSGRTQTGNSTCPATYKYEELVPYRNIVWIYLKAWNQCCGSGSGIRHPLPFWPLDPGSRIPNPYFLELSDNFLGKKLYNFLKIGPNFFLRIKK